MQHYYYDNSVFHGKWYSFFLLYSNMVKKFPSGSKFVEVGAGIGQSASAMAVEIINSGKDIHFTTIDSFAGEERKNLDVYLKNIKPVSHVVNTMICDSKKAAEMFPDNSLDFVFLDANPTYESVKRDIFAWLTKVKMGGVLAGHNFHGDFYGVVKAVDEIFGPSRLSPWYDYDDWCWYVEIDCKY